MEHGRRTRSIGQPRSSDTVIDPRSKTPKTPCLTAQIHTPDSASSTCHAGERCRRPSSSEHRRRGCTGRNHYEEYQQDPAGHGWHLSEHTSSRPHPSSRFRYMRNLMQPSGVVSGERQGGGPSTGRQRSDREVEEWRWPCVRATRSCPSGFGDSGGTSRGPGPCRGRGRDPGRLHQGIPIARSVPAGISVPPVAAGHRPK